MATKKVTTTAAKPVKPLADLATFIENVNKKDRGNGKKVNFNFVKRKRKPTKTSRG
jgi:hypothetical protein